MGITDHEWFEILARESAKATLDEVNFWQPSPRAFRALSPGELFLFKLHRPAAVGRDVIVGGGFFAYWTELPASVAWDVFGIANGARSLLEMRARIERYRRNGTGSRDYRVGCIALTRPFFFEPETWVEIHEWAGSVQVGKSFPLTEDEGRRIWREIETRLLVREALDPPTAVAAEGPRYREIVSRQRYGQGSFRLLVTDAYERTCAVTRERALPALEAAHIRPYADGGEHAISNGILLRSDLHRLFDAGYVTVSPEHRLEVSRRLRTEFNNGEQYLALHGSGLWVPSDLRRQPDPDLLAWHNQNRFVA